MKKIPQRQCIACRRMKDKTDLIRIVKAPDGIVTPDFAGKKNGRGAYICRSEECLKKVCKNKLFHKAFKTSIGEDVYTSIQKWYDHESKS